MLRKLRERDAAQWDEVAVSVVAIGYSKENVKALRNADGVFSKSLSRCFGAL
jgi:hypothetical protein